MSPSVEGVAGLVSDLILNLFKRKPRGCPPYSAGARLQRLSSFVHTESAAARTAKRAIVGNNCLSAAKGDASRPCVFDFFRRRKFPFPHPSLRLVRSDGC
jgi:hypothetical protein